MLWFRRTSLNPPVLCDPLRNRSCSALLQSRFVLRPALVVHPNLNLGLLACSVGGRL